MAAEQALVATAGYSAFRASRAGPEVQLAGDLLFAFGTPALALGYGAALLLARRLRAAGPFSRRSPRSAAWR